VWHATITRREMLKVGLGFGAAAVVGAHVPHVHALGNNAWHSKTQAERASDIFVRGWQDLNKVMASDMNCKEWVRKVIFDVSGGHVNIPSTMPNENGWYWADDPHVNRRDGSHYIDMEFGDVVQMQWQGETMITPHTFIVSGVYRSASPPTFFMLDCNWRNDLVVRDHSMTYDEFGASVVNYCIHYIL
jgi:hypothetical protein